MKSYYYVFNPHREIPQRKHNTLKKAKMESERLARTYPGTAFEILHCIGISQANIVNTFWMDEVDPDEFTN